MVNEEDGYLTGPNSNPLGNKEQQKKERSDKLETLKLQRRSKGVSDHAPFRGRGGPRC
jgi:hypothetical protein